MGIETAEGASERRDPRVGLGERPTEGGFEPAAEKRRPLSGSGETQVEPEGQAIRPDGLETPTCLLDGGEGLGRAVFPESKDRLRTGEAPLHGGRELSGAFVETEEALFETPAGVAGEEPLSEGREAPQEFAPVWDRAFRRSARCRPVEIRGEVGERAIDLVADAGHDRDGAAADGGDDLPGVEGGEILA